MRKVVCVLENETRKNVCEGELGWPAEPCERANYCKYNSICKAEAPQSDDIRKTVYMHIHEK